MQVARAQDAGELGPSAGDGSSWKLANSIANYFKLMRIVRSPWWAELPDVIRNKKKSNLVGSMQERIGQHTPLANHRFEVSELNDRVHVLHKDKSQLSQYPFLRLLSIGTPQWLHGRLA